MDSFGPARQGVAAASATWIGRELSVAADLSLWAGDQDRCIAIIARLYDLFDDFELGLAPDWNGQIVAADTAAWVGNKDRCTILVDHVLDTGLLKEGYYPGSAVGSGYSEL